MYVYIFSNYGHSCPMKSEKDMSNDEALKELENYSPFSYKYLNGHCKIEKKEIKE